MKLFTLVLILMGSFFFGNLNAQESKEGEAGMEEVKVHVYYFHLTRRCATCNAVEKVALQTVTDHYGDNVCFTAHNLEEEKGEEVAATLGVEVQSLLIVAGEKQINVTNEGFLYARANPKKMVEILKEKIDSLL